LILSNPEARWHGGLLGGDLSLDTFRALVLSNRRMASLAMAEAMLGNSFDAAALQWFFRTRQESVTPEILAQLLTLGGNTDVRDLFHKVSVPTLVAHYRNDRLLPFEAGRELAAGIPGARFVPLEGDAHLFFFNDTRPLRRAIAEFLGDPIEDAAPPPSDSLSWLKYRPRKQNGG
jgi:pimeloyl-ACP methyl ester carboxylesterase